MSKNKVKMKK